MNKGVATQLLTIFVSVAVSSIGYVFYTGQQDRQVSQNTTDIKVLQEADNEMKALVTQLRIDMAAQTATTNTKLDVIMEAVKKE